jgi:hypothetical protein
VILPAERTGGEKDPRSMLQTFHPYSGLIEVAAPGEGTVIRQQQRDVTVQEWIGGIA